jgi:hypothetical protein
MPIVECTLGDAAPDPSPRYLNTRFPDCPARQVHAEGVHDYQTAEGIRVAPAVALLRTPARELRRGRRQPV